ncbi:MAG: PLP-dependent aminotransferase family protein [Clostridiales bacterium]|nr:PLP-dependent aminotransferase family protein [Clostridiales bacterium]
MKYAIDYGSNIPAYLQLYKQVRDDIVKGIYPSGSKLPSKRTIADEVGVSTVTIEHAYALLCDEGYIETRERSGYFVIFQIDDGFAASANKERPRIHHAYPHESPSAAEFPFSVLTKTMRKVMSDFGESILDRSPNTGCTVLREEISRYLARSRGVHTKPEQIIIGSGSEYLYSLIVELLGRNKKYAIESPSYKKIEQVYRSSDVQLEKLPLGHDGIDSASLRACKADVLHISPYRSYPSGVTASASKRHEYLRWAGQSQRFIVEDDFESEFSLSQKAEETLFSHTSNDNVIYMNTFSMTISPSFRVGYMVLPKHLVPEFEDRLGFYSCTVPTYIQLVLAELIANGDFERHINRVRRAKRKELSK